MEGFLRVVEVFPPSFSIDKKAEPEFALRQKTRDLLEKIKKIQKFTDYILVADINDISRVKVSTLVTASMIQEQLNVRSVPVITARDSNRISVRSQILTALSLGIEAIMLVWGDRYVEGAKNVYDYASLSDMISEAREISERAGKRITMFAPVNLSSLSTEKGLEIARERLFAGASYLLAQPPTADNVAFDLHSKIIEEKGLYGKVLLNVFPFRDKQDIETCRKRFGWSLSPDLEKIAEKGEIELLKVARGIAERIKRMNFPGVYVSTRGRPEIARFILE